MPRSRTLTNGIGIDTQAPWFLDNSHAARSGETPWPGTHRDWWRGRPPIELIFNAEKGAMPTTCF
jgi:hypothetical protein